MRSYNLHYVCPLKCGFDSTQGFPYDDSTSRPLSVQDPLSVYVNSFEAFIIITINYCFVHIVIAIL